VVFFAAWIVFLGWFLIPCLNKIMQYITTFFAETSCVRGGRCGSQRVRSSIARDNSGAAQSAYIIMIAPLYR